MTSFDAIVIGGGIVGAATALRLLQAGDIKRLLLLEKEAHPAEHQTGRNSGVIHAGVYYPPGSRKALLCRQGLLQTKSFCDQYEIPYETRGKLIVASDEHELERMQALSGRAQANGTYVEQLSARELQTEEPKIHGIGALLVPESGIVDYRAITAKLLELVTQLGGEIQYNSEVLQIDECDHDVQVRTRWGDHLAQIAVCCSGLWSDQLLARSGVKTDFRIIPFRGSYYRLSPRCNDWVRRLIYPVPDPERPFLGVHITPMMGGFLTVGPNASLALSRESYTKQDVDWRDALSQFRYPGLYRLLSRHAKSAALELALTLSKSRYLQAVNKYCPSVRLTDLQYHAAGHRAQAVARDGSLIEDFRFYNTSRMVHVCNAPSPAATSALPIASEIAMQAMGLMNSC